MSFEKKEIDPDFSGEYSLKKEPETLNNARKISSRITRLTVGSNEIEEKMPSIRLNQLKGLKKLKEFIEVGKTQGYFRMPTGAGKTILFGLIAQMLNEPTLILVPNTTLLDSTKNELISLGIDPEKIGLVGDKKEQNGRQYTIMTYQSFLTRGKPRGTSLIICDEVHRSLGEKTRAKIDGALDNELELNPEPLISEEDLEAEKQALSELNKIKNEILVLGFTATPVLGSKSVEDIHGELIAETHYAELVNSGILKNVEVHQVEAEIDRETESSYLNSDKEAKLLERTNICRKTLQSFVRFKDSFTEYPLRPIAFCNSVRGCEICQTEAESLGLKCMIVTGERGNAEEAEKALFAGTIDLIITVKKLQEGWNYPALNSVLWIRGTSSPAALIQGVGRAMRSFEKERTAHLFEADWRVSGTTSHRLNRETKLSGEKHGTTKNSNLKQSTKAITFAQALALIGEDVNSVVRNANELDYNHYYELGEDGVADVEGVGTVCGLEAYAIIRKTSGATIKRWWGSNPPKPVEGIAGISCFRTVELYLKSDIDRIISENRKDLKVKLESNGTANLDKVGEVCGLAPYAAFRKIVPDTLKNWVKEKGLVPVDGVEGSVGSKPGPVYKRSEVDEVIKSKRPAQVIALDDKGTFDLKGVGVVCGLHQYSAHIGVSHTSVSLWVKDAGHSPVKNVEGKSGPKFFPLYLKADVDKAVSANRAQSVIRLDQDGTAYVDGIGEVCGASAYADSDAVNMSPRTLKLWLEKADIQPIEGIQGGTGKKPGNLFKKSEVDEVIRRNKA